MEVCQSLVDDVVVCTAELVRFWRSNDQG